MSTAKPTDYKLGQIVAIHPGCDVWMRGVKFGEVIKIGRKWVHIKGTLTETTHKILPRNLLPSPR